DDLLLPRRRQPRSRASGADHLAPPLPAAQLVASRVRQRRTSGLVLLSRRAADLELCGRRPGGTLDACASRPATTGARRRGANLPTLGRLGVASLRDQDP